MLAEGDCEGSAVLRRRRARPEAEIARGVCRSRQDRCRTQRRHWLRIRHVDGSTLDTGRHMLNDLYGYILRSSDHVTACRFDMTPVQVAISGSLASREVSVKGRQIGHAGMLIAVVWAGQLGSAASLRAPSVLSPSRPGNPLAISSSSFPGAGRTRYPDT